MKIGLGNKKGFSQYDNASPHHSITIEQDIAQELSDSELVEHADRLHKLARQLVEKKINDDISELRAP